MKPELEDLVAAALADNQITEGEMRVLLRKAKELGLDEDEFRLELEARRHKMQQKNAQRKTITPELEGLIKAALIDKKLSGTELKVLLKRAKELGLDEDEFRLELESRKYKMRQEGAEEKAEFWRSNGKLIAVVSLAALIIITSVIVIILSSDTHKLKRFARKNELKYIDWNEALVNYDFANAYALIPYYKQIKYSKIDDYDKVVGTIAEVEVNYLFSEGYIERGLEVAQENFVENYYDEDKGISNGELKEIILKNYDILISKQKYNEALKLIHNYKQVEGTSSLGELTDISFIKDLSSMESYNSLVVPYNEILQRLFQKVSRQQISDFDYMDLLTMYRPIAKSNHLGTKKIKNITPAKYEDRVVTNLFGKPRKDDNGKVITEKILVDKGGEVYYTEQELYNFYLVNEYQKEAIKNLNANSIIY